MTKNERTTCLVVGGGPAGLVLGLLMARAGVEVTVLEKHADFLRDFRGDTVHASTLNLLDELGLDDRFAALPQRAMTRAQVQLDCGMARVADMSRLPGPHKYIAMVPQWDFLDLIADEAETEPSFTLRRNAEVIGLLRDDGPHSRVAGVRYRDRTDGSEHELRASLTIGCDGRGSVVAAEAGLVPRSFGAPMDVWWFRLPREQGDPEGGVMRVTSGNFAVLIDRGDYWQAAYLIGKGSDAVLRREGIDAFRARLAALVPWLAERLATITSFDDVKLLDVKLNRQRRWAVDGLLLIGDAAHAMSPVAGVGINLAVADAVATARLLAPALRSGGIVPLSMLRAVQRRRWWPTALVQAGQRLAHNVLISGPVAVASSPAGSTAPASGLLDDNPQGLARMEDLPLPLRLLRRFPVLQGIPARIVAIGPLPEHAPAWARRSNARA
ncbi:FAD-dependent oxidoreductase [Pseudonocardia sp. TRM90224]|uniref:FAD-dependent oxidoreductase n=1 Tax=Pseudonocardia sp. TRM90224 TaxID=2812678 RepID=UPI001E3B1D4E|nr:FAD-dependent oxidoreductase [Pseudonocardia sp. TRM90224]